MEMVGAGWEQSRAALVLLGDARCVSSRGALVAWRASASVCCDESTQCVQ